MTPTLTRRRVLELTCVRCLRYRYFEGETKEAAGRLAESKGWAVIGGKVYCNKCPHPVKPKPAAPATPDPSPVLPLPTRLESADEIIARLVRDGQLIKNASGLVALSPQARQMRKEDMARLLRPRGI